MYSSDVNVHDVDCLVVIKKERKPHFTPKQAENENYLKSHVK